MKTTILLWLGMMVFASWVIAQTQTPQVIVPEGFPTDVPTIIPTLLPGEKGPVYPIPLQTPQKLKPTPMPGAQP